MSNPAFWARTAASPKASVILRIFFRDMLVTSGPALSLSLARSSSAVIFLHRNPGRDFTSALKSESDWCSWAQSRQPSAWTSSAACRYSANPFLLYREGPNPWGSTGTSPRMIMAQPPLAIRCSRASHSPVGTPMEVGAKRMRFFS